MSRPDRAADIARDRPAVVDAADYPNPNDPLGDPAQCQQPYPAGTFDGQIVLCDRGSIPRFLKSLHVRDGGAGGIVFANTPDGLSSLVADVFAIPGIHISAEDSARLREWLAVGDEHFATITPALASDDPTQADRLGTVASHGPNQGLDFLAPSLAAPGLGIRGAWIAPDDYASAPEWFGHHAGAGAIALVKAQWPYWSDAEILSALMTTASSDLRQEPLLEPADPWAYGGGRVDVVAAILAGLTLDESDLAFAQADPAGGGEPRDLNLAGLVDNACEGVCSWRRFVRSRPGALEWAVAASMRDDDVAITVTPETFQIAGGYQAIDVVVDARAVSDGGYRFGEVTLTSISNPGIPPAVLQVAVDVLVDSDGDGVANRHDNCTTQANPAQRDSDNDGYGNYCDADLDNSGIVNTVDLGLMRQRFGGDNAHADLDGNGVVDSRDLDILRGQFHAPPGPSGVVDD